MTLKSKMSSSATALAVMLLLFGGCQPPVAETPTTDAPDGTATSTDQPSDQGGALEEDPHDPQTRKLGSSELLLVDDFSALSAQELFDGARTLRRHLSRGDTDANREDDYRASRRKILEIADELLTRDLEERLRYGAILIQFDALSELINVETPGAVDEMEQLATGYLEANDRDVVRVAREHLLMLETLRLAEDRQIDVDKLTQLIGDYLAAAAENDRRLTHADLMLVRQVATELENAGRYGAAQQVFELAGTAFVDADTEAVRGTAQDIANNGLKRLALVGEPLVLSGTLIDGGSFDWSQYEGKIVLVDFWASWCGPCVREFPALKEKYAKYREQGFEIVGVCLDEEPSPAERAISLFKLPWPILYSQDDQQRGWNDPLAKKCGIHSLPAMFLLDREGRVVSLSARGERLDMLLAEMLED